MRINYQADSDMLLISLSDIASDESEEIAPGVVFDFSVTGDIVGIEVSAASQKMDVSRLIADNAVERKNVTATRSEWSAIDAAAQAQGMSRSAYLVHAATASAKQPKAKPMSAPRAKASPGVLAKSISGGQVSVRAHVKRTGKSKGATGSDKKFG